nr:MAG TPA: hypothetical protein [Caudoviricetes sp.]
MALVKKQWAAKEKSQIEKITIRYEDGTERTVESGLVVTFSPAPNEEECEIIQMESKHFTGMQWYMLARALGEALYLNDLELQTEDE